MFDVLLDIFRPYKIPPAPDPWGIRDNIKKGNAMGVDFVSLHNAWKQNVADSENQLSLNMAMAQRFGAKLDQKEQSAIGATMATGLAKEFERQEYREFPIIDGNSVRVPRPVADKRADE